jgi:hypothetical protein
MTFLQTIDDLCNCVKDNPRHIAESLGRLWRFGGQHPTASVLYHSLEVRWMCRHMSNAAQLWALWHDVHEILTGEIPRPHKSTELINLQSFYDMRLRTTLGFTLSLGEVAEIESNDLLCGNCERHHGADTIWMWMSEADGLAVDEFIRLTTMLRADQ